MFGFIFIVQFIGIIWIVEAEAVGVKKGRAIVNEPDGAYLRTRLEDSVRATSRPMLRAVLELRGQTLVGRRSVQGGDLRQEA